MDSSVIGGNQGNASQLAIAAVAQQTKSAARESEANVKQVTQTKETVEDTLNPKAQENKRFAVVQKAAVAMTYAVSDLRFTIYREEGQYITRFTSLRDGTVSIVPEPALLAQVGSGGGVILATNA